MKIATFASAALGLQSGMHPHFALSGAPESEHAPIMKISHDAPSPGHLSGETVARRTANSRRLLQTLSPETPAATIGTQLTPPQPQTMHAGPMSPVEGLPGAYKLNAEYRMTDWCGNQSRLPKDSTWYFQKDGCTVSAVPAALPGETGQVEFDTIGCYGIGIRSSHVINAFSIGGPLPTRDCAC